MGCKTHRDERNEKNMQAQERVYERIAHAMGDCSSLRELKSPSDVRTGGKGCSVSACKELIKWSTILGRGEVCSDCEFSGGKTWGARA